MTAINISLFSYSCPLRAVRKISHLTAGVQLTDSGLERGGQWIYWEPSHALEDHLVWSLLLNQCVWGWLSPFSFSGPISSGNVK